MDRKEKQKCLMHASKIQATTLYTEINFHDKNNIRIVVGEAMHEICRNISVLIKQKLLQYGSLDKGS